MTLQATTPFRFDPAAGAPRLLRQSAGRHDDPELAPTLLGAHALFKGPDSRVNGGAPLTGLALEALPQSGSQRAAPLTDCWYGLGTVERGMTAGVHWASDGSQLFGSIDLPESAEGPPLEAMSLQAYGAIFQTLQETGMRSMLRVWNYVPRINGEADGMERYRRFNLGRQRAFMQAGWSAFEGAPAASAVGSHGDAPLQIRFLASRTVPLAVENPRQVPAYHYPAIYGAASPTFSRAALVADISGDFTLFASGTASIIGHESVHLGDVAEQTRESWRNLRAILGAANLQCGVEFDLRSAALTAYVRHARDSELVHRVMSEELGHGAPALQSLAMLHADICRAELLVEIEAVATG